MPWISGPSHQKRVCYFVCSALTGSVILWVRLLLCLGSGDFMFQSRPGLCLDFQGFGGHRPPPPLANKLTILFSLEVNFPHASCALENARLNRGADARATCVQSVVPCATAGV